jgi:hypothetical protein
VQFKKYILFAKSLMVLSTGWSHDAETTKPVDKMHAHGTFEAHAHAGWESRYFSEGRDALDGKSLWTGTLELGYDHFSGGVWYGSSSDQNYDEWQYSLALTQESEGYEFYLGYTYLGFHKDNDSDSEWSAGISYGELPFALEASLDASYSMDAEGTFFEWSTGRKFNPNETLQLSLSGILGWNEGYVSDGHDGLNFFALRTGAKADLSEKLSLVAHGAQSFAVDRDPTLSGDQLLKDFFHFGLGLEWSF